MKKPAKAIAEIRWRPVPSHARLIHRYMDKGESQSKSITRLLTALMAHTTGAVLLSDATYIPPSRFFGHRLHNAIPYSPPPRICGLILDLLQRPKPGLSEEAVLRDALDVGIDWLDHLLPNLPPHDAVTLLREAVVWYGWEKEVEVKVIVERFAVYSSEAQVHAWLMELGDRHKIVFSEDDRCVQLAKSRVLAGVPDVVIGDDVTGQTVLWRSTRRFGGAAGADARRLLWGRSE